MQSFFVEGIDLPDRTYYRADESLIEGVVWSCANVDSDIEVPDVVVDIETDDSAERT